MMETTGKFTLFAGLAVFAGLCSGSYVPWDILTEDYWIDFFDDQDPFIYPVNAADADDVKASYPVSFSQAGGNNKAKGMNGLKFERYGRIEGHLVSSDLEGVFGIVNNGNDNYYNMLLLSVAIDAESLDEDFRMEIGIEGQLPYVLDANDFAYYENQYGRMSGVLFDYESIG